MSKRKIMTLAAALLCALLLTGIALADGTTTIERYVVGGGGGHAEAGDLTLDGTVGQPIAGTASSGPYELCAGFWCGVAVQHTIYLPLVPRDY